MRQPVTIVSVATGKIIILTISKKNSVPATFEPWAKTSIAIIRKGKKFIRVKTCMYLHQWKRDKLAKSDWRKLGSNVLTRMFHFVIGHSSIPGHDIFLLCNLDRCRWHLRETCRIRKGFENEMKSAFGCGGTREGRKWWLWEDVSLSNLPNNIFYSCRKLRTAQLTH